MKHQYSTKNNSVGHLTWVHEEKLISFIYMICFYRGFGIDSIISLMFTKTFNTLIYQHRNTIISMIMNHIDLLEIDIRLKQFCF